MDGNGDIWRFRLLLFIALIFLVSCYLSGEEFRYLTRGRTAEATITRVYKTTRGLRDPERVWVAEYEFTDQDGLHRKDDTEVPNAWDAPEGGKLPIEYLPGKLGATRPAGAHAYFALIIVALCFGAGTFIIVKWWREATQPIGRARSSRR